MMGYTWIRTTNRVCVMQRRGSGTERGGLMDRFSIADRILEGESMLDGISRVVWLVLVTGVMMLVPGVSSGGDQPEAGPPKLIATGWDHPTPAQFRRHVAEFERWPFQGAVIRATRTGPGGKEIGSTFAFGRDHWDEAAFAASIADLQAAKSSKRGDYFLLINANPGDVDWFDDDGWAQVVDHWRLLARAARQGGLKGLLYDAEPYSPPHAQFYYAKQKGRDQHTFAEYIAKARGRGRDVMRAVAAEYPGITILAYRLISDLPMPELGQPDTTPMLEGHIYGLCPAFLDGWLDVAPPSVTIVEGNESAYRYNSVAEFDHAYVTLTTRAPRLLAPENRAKYRAQVQVGHGIYLDAHGNPPGSPWYIDPMGGSRGARLEANVAAALHACDGYVWIYGEKGRWWPSDGPGSPTWPEVVPGADRALLRAVDPAAAARQRRAALGPKENRLKNASFTAGTADGLPEHWWTWQNDDSQGKFDLDADTASARVRGVSSGCFGQNVEGARPGEDYVVAARCRGEGAGAPSIRVRWKDAKGRWTAEGRDVFILPHPPAKPNGWRELIGLARVPDGAAELVILLSASGQREPKDSVWFDDVIVAPLGPVALGPVEKD